MMAFKERVMGLPTHQELIRYAETVEPEDGVGDPVKAITVLLDAGFTVGWIAKRLDDFDPRRAQEAVDIVRLWEDTGGLLQRAARMGMAWHALAEPGRAVRLEQQPAERMHAWLRGWIDRSHTAPTVNVGRILLGMGLATAMSDDEIAWVRQGNERAIEHGGK